MSDYHPAVTCEKCNSTELKLISPLRLQFQPHTQCLDCGNEELEILIFMRCMTAMEEHDAREKGEVTT